MSAFLEPEDVKKLTGYERPSFQLRFCKREGILAWMSAKGEVVIPRAAVEGRKAANEPSWKPDLGVFRKA